jgi:hypothetical protein
MSPPSFSIIGRRLMRRHDGCHSWVLQGNCFPAVVDGADPKAKAGRLELRTSAASHPPACLSHLTCDLLRFTDACKPCDAAYD